MYIYIYVYEYIYIYVCIYICITSSGSFDSLNFLATQVFGKNHPKSCKVLCVYAESFYIIVFCFLKNVWRVHLAMMVSRAGVLY